MSLNNVSGTYIAYQELILHIMNLYNVSGTYITYQELI
jgi:hypothetical protein